MIRSACREDAPDIAHVQVVSWQAAYRGLLGDRYLDSLDPVERAGVWDWILNDRERGTLVAESDGQVVGFCLFGSSFDVHWGEVFAIYTLPAYWGRGLGRRLLDAGERALLDRGHSRALLWVLDSNRRARDFYERQGWSLGKPIRLETIGGTEVTEVRYEKELTS